MKYKSRYYSTILQFGCLNLFIMDLIKYFANYKIAGLGLFVFFYIAYLIFQPGQNNNQTDNETKRLVIFSATILAIVCLYMKDMQSEPPKPPNPPTPPTGPPFEPKPIPVPKPGTTAGVTIDSNDIKDSTKPTPNNQTVLQDTIKKSQSRTKKNIYFNNFNNKKFKTIFINGSKTNVNILQDGESATLHVIDGEKIIIQFQDGTAKNMIFSNNNILPQ